MALRFPPEDTEILFAESQRTCWTKHEVIAAEVLHVTVYGTSTEVCTSINRSTLPQVHQPWKLVFITAIVITGKAGLGSVPIMSSRCIPSRKIISSLSEECIGLRSNTILEICQWPSGP